MPGPRNCVKNLLQGWRADIVYLIVQSLCSCGFADWIFLCSVGILLLWNTRVVEKLDGAVGALMWDEVVGVLSWWYVPCALEEIQCGEIHFKKMVGSSNFTDLMLDFSDFIAFNGLIELPLNGGAFTWSNDRDVCFLS